MIDLIVLLILIVFVVVLIFTFFSFISLLLNLAVLIALYFLIRKDLKSKDNHKYYLFSLLLTAIFFILSNTEFVKNILILTQKLLLSAAIIPLIGVYIFAHLIAFVYESYIYLKEKH